MGNENTVDILIKARGDLQGIQQTVQQLDGLKQKASGLFDSLQNGLVVGAGIKIADSLTQLPALLNEITSSGETMAGRLESMQVAFETLLGGTADAKARMEELRKFAADTPFQIPEVAQASRTLEMLTHGALSSGQGLRMVGDAATAAQMPIADMAMWIGRLYDGLKSGREVGESLMRLQEMAVISGDTRGKIEELQKSGAKGSDVWAVAATEFDKYAGSMKRGSETLEGIKSNLEDAWSTAKTDAVKDFAEHSKASLGELAAVIGSPEVKEGLKELISGILRTKDTLIELQIWAAKHATALGALATGAKALATAYAAVSVARKVSSFAASATAMTSEAAAVNANTAAWTKNAAARGASNSRASVTNTPLIVVRSSADIAQSLAGPTRNAPDPEAYRRFRADGMTAERALFYSRQIGNPENPGRAMQGLSAPALSQASQAALEASKAAETGARQMIAFTGAIGQLGHGLAGMVGGIAAALGPIGIGLFAGQAMVGGAEWAAGKYLGWDFDGLKMAKGNTKVETQQRIKELVHRTPATEEERDALLKKLDELGGSDPDFASYVATGKTRLRGITGLQMRDEQLERDREGLAKAQDEYRKASAERERAKQLENIQDRAEKNGDARPLEDELTRTQSRINALKSKPEDQRRTKDFEELNGLEKERDALEKLISSIREAQKEKARLRQEKLYETDLAEAHASGDPRRVAQLEWTRNKNEALQSGLSEAEAQRYANAKSAGEGKAVEEKKQELALEIQLSEAKAAGNDKEQRRLEWIKEYKRVTPWAIGLVAGS